MLVVAADDGTDIVDAADLESGDVSVLDGHNGALVVLVLRGHVLVREDTTTPMETVAGVVE